MNADSYHKPVMRDGSKDLRTLLERYLVRSGHAATVVARKVVIRRLMVDIYNLWEGVWFGALLIVKFEMARSITLYNASKLINILLLLQLK